MKTAPVNEATAKNGLVAESDLSYQPPDAGDQEDLNAIARDVISEIQDEFDDASASKYAQEAGADPLDGASTSDEEAGEAGSTDTDGEADTQKSADGESDDAAPTDDGDDKETADPKLARSLERAVQRELAAKEAESAAKAAKAQADAALAELRSLQGLKSTKELQEMMDLDPQGAIKAMGKDPAVIIKLMLAQELGDKAPPELKEFSRDYETKREVAQLRAQLKQQEQVRQQQEYFNSIASGAREYVTKSVGASTPTFAMVAKANPERAYREIMEEISRDAQARMAVDPNGEPMSYQDAAKRVEERLAEWKTLLVQNSTPAAPTQGNKKPAATLPPQSKPPAKPLAPWAKKPDDDLYEAGIREAVLEFNRLEAQNRATRRR